MAMQLSNQLREAGNENFNKGEYFEALCNYNNSLIAAKRFDLKLLMALAYGNRSAVYFKVNQYEKCLENIELAKLNGYPADKLQKLETREKKCHKMIEKQQQQDPDDDPKDFFKLSYQANEKIPFIVNCLEIREDHKGGRGIFTNRDLKAGDVISIEEPLFADHPLNHMQCDTCFKQNMLNLIPGDCLKMFCSNKCRSKGDHFSAFSEEFLKHPIFDPINKALSISGGYEELRKIFAKPTKQTVFDFNLSNLNDAETKLNMLKCAASLKVCKDVDIAEKVKPVCRAFQLSHVLQVPRRKKEIVIEFFHRYYLICFYNGFVFKMINTALPIFLPLINHSCDANIDFIEAYGRFVAVVNRPLSAGDQLFKTIEVVFEETSKVERQRMILKRMQYTCDCNACVGDYPLFPNLRHADTRFKMPPNSFGTVKETTDELKKNWSYIALNMKNHPAFEISTLILRDRALLDHLGTIVDCPLKKAI